MIEVISLITSLTVTVVNYGFEIVIYSFLMGRGSALIGGLDFSFINSSEPNL